MSRRAWSYSPLGVQPCCLVWHDVVTYRYMPLGFRNFMLGLPHCVHSPYHYTRMLFDSEIETSVCFCNETLSTYAALIHGIRQERLRQTMQNQDSV